MEISISTSRNDSESVHRAMYILSCLGSNIKYTSFGGPISRPLVLRARQGFKEQIRSLRSAIACDTLKEESVSLICSASLFESMTSGYSSGLEVIEDAFPFSGSSSSLSFVLDMFGWYHFKALLLALVWSVFTCNSFTIRNVSYSCYSFACHLRLSITIGRNCWLRQQANNIISTIMVLCHARHFFLPSSDV